MRGVGARSASLVAVLDDLHRADVSSLRLLAFLARQLHDAAVLVVGTYRGLEVTAADRPARLLLGEIGGQAELLQLTGLTADEVGHLVHKVCGERPPAAHTTAVHERTAGNPFFVQQIALAARCAGRPLDRAPVTGVPPAVSDVLARGLARLSHEVVDVAAVAAVVGRRFSIAMVAAIAGLPTEAAVALIDAATRAGVVEHDDPAHARFSHDLFRQVLYEGLPAARRSTIHLVVAELLEDHADPATTAAEIAHHRILALPLGDRDRAITALVLATVTTATLVSGIWDLAAGHPTPHTLARRNRIRLGPHPGRARHPTMIPTTPIPDHLKRPV